jgi:hypothetical protein
MVDKIYVETASPISNSEEHEWCILFGQREDCTYVGLRLSMSGGTRPLEEFCVTAGRETAIFSQESRLLVY